MEIEEYSDPSLIEFQSTNCIQNSDGYSVTPNSYQFYPNMELKSPFQSLQQSTDVQIRSTSTSEILVREVKKESKKKSAKSNEGFKVVEFSSSLIRHVSQRQNYYLIGDISIDFDLLRGKESRFSPLADFRPVVSVERDIFNKFVEIQLGSVEPGMTNFRNVISQLDSMNDKFAHGIAILLSRYQQLIDFKIKMKGSVSKSKNSSMFCVDSFYQEALVKAKEIIAEKRKENKYLAYFISKGQYIDSTMMCQGVSEQLLDVLGLDCDTFRSISLRRGLLDFVEPLQRYFIMVEKFANVAKNKMPWESVHLISIDNFKIPVEVKAEKILLNRHLCYENHLQFLNIQINEKVVSDLKLKRYRARSVIKNPDYLTLGEEFTYSIETEVFLEKYYPKCLIQEEEEKEEINEEGLGQVLYASNAKVQGVNSSILSETLNTTVVTRTSSGSDQKSDNGDQSNFVDLEIDKEDYIFIE